MRYDVVYTVHLPVIGELTLYYDSIRVHGYNIYISGYDNEHNPIELTLDKLKYPQERPGDYGYCHIISYTIRGQVVHCDIYTSFH